MSIEKLPSGTRGPKAMPSFLARLATRIMIPIHRRTGNTMSGMDLLYLTTVGAKSGQRRTAPVARFEDGAGGWLVVASAGGSISHPGWYHNVVAQPDQVQVEVDGVRRRVKVEQLDGTEREQAWQRLLQRAPRFGGYQTKTDRQLPLLRLTPID